MQTIKNAVEGLVGSKDEGPYDNKFGGQHSSHHTSSTHSSHMHTEGQVTGERVVGMGVAEVPVVVTEQERMSTGVSEVRNEVQVCGQKQFTEVEDRPVVRERVERIMEHRPVEKQYVVETRFVGEREMGVSHTEIVDVKERIVEVAQPGPACPANAGQVMNQVVNSMTGASTDGRVI